MPGLAHLRHPGHMRRGHQGESDATAASRIRDSNAQAHSQGVAIVDFPEDLLKAQLELNQVNAELDALYERLPWPSEPLPGWTHMRDKGYCYETKRDDSPGWTEDEKAEVARLRAHRLELVTAVITHPFWATCDDAPTARSALKHVHNRPDETAA